MSKKKIAALLAALMVTLSCLSACSVQGKTSNNSNSISIATTAKADDFVPKTRVFEPGMHAYRKRFYVEWGFTGDRQIPVPEGYTILSVDNWNDAWSGTTYTAGFDVTYVNTVTVEATSSQKEVKRNKFTEGFYEPGVVVGKEVGLVFTNGN